MTPTNDWDYSTTPASSIVEAPIQTEEQAINFVRAFNTKRFHTRKIVRVRKIGLKFFSDDQEYDMNLECGHGAVCVGECPDVGDGIFCPFCPVTPEERT